MSGTQRDQVVFCRVSTFFEWKQVSALHCFITIAKRTTGIATEGSSSNACGPSAFHFHTMIKFLSEYGQIRPQSSSYLRGVNEARHAAGMVAQQNRRTPSAPDSAAGTGVSWLRLVGS